MHRPKKGAKGSIRDDMSKLDKQESFSMQSTSQLGGAWYSSFEIKKVENINTNVKALVFSKSPIEAFLIMLKTIKETFKAVTRCSIFVMNRHL